VYDIILQNDIQCLSEMLTVSYHWFRN